MFRDNFVLYDYIVLGLCVLAFIVGCRLLWLGNRWSRRDVLPPPRRSTRRQGSVPEYPR